MFPKDLDQKNLSYKLSHYQGFSIYGNTCNLIIFMILIDFLVYGLTELIKF